MQIPFCGPSYQGRSLNLDPTRSINFYPEISSTQDSKSVVALVGTPGTRAFCTFPTGVIRMTHTVAGRCFTVVADTLYEVYSDGSHSLPLAFLPDSTGRISAADNGVTANGVGGNQLLMVTNGKGYIYNFSTGVLGEITDPNFPPAPEQATYLDGYFAVTNGSMVFWVSELYDGTSWSGLAFAAAISTPDSIQRPYSLHQNLYLIKENVTEVWYNTGTPTSQGCPYSRVAGAVIDYGTPAPWSIARGDNVAFFLATRRNDDSGEFAGVAMLSGYQISIVSTPAIDYRISKLTSLSDAWGYCYRDEGHVFYVLTFPTDDLTLVYDSTTQMWHERSWVSTNAAVQHRHVGNTYTYFAGKHLLGHCTDSKLLEMSSLYYDDDGDPIISIRVAQPLYDHNELDNVTITKLVIDVEGGVGDGTVQPADVGYAWIADGSHDADGTGYAGGFDLILSPSGDPQAYLSWSNDGGHRWSNNYPASVGRRGEYSQRLIWRRLGSPRNRVFKLTWSAAVKKIIAGAYVNNGAMPS